MNRGEYLELSDLSLLLTRPWFRRIWIVQELALAPKAILQCGHDTLPWEILSEILSSFKDNKGRGELFVERAVESSRLPGANTSGLSAHSAFYAGILDLARKRIQSGELFSLREALRCFHSFDATLPLDKVYGLLGLVEDPACVEVDYKLSPKQLYLRTSCQIFESTKNLRLFLNCVQTTEDSHVKGLPNMGTGLVIKSAARRLCAHCDR